MKQLDIFKQRVRSISYSEEEIILNILELHSPAGEINIDPTYSKGVFYQGRVPQPLLKSDIDPQLENCDKIRLPKPSTFRCFCWMYNV